jgi:CpeT/CpcT family (DUF1001)
MQLLRLSAVDSTGELRVRTGALPMTIRYAALPILLLLGACDAEAAETQTGTVASVSDLASLFEGEFTTLPDTGPAPAGAKPLYNLAKRVQIPALGDEVVYAEQHENAADGPMLWQKLYGFKFDPDQKLIVMTPYTIGSNGHTVAGAYKDPTPLAKMDVSALKPETGGCVVIWHRIESGFDGTLKPGSCKGAPDVSKVDKPAITVTKTDYTEQPLSGSGAPTVFRRIH